MAQIYRPPINWLTEAEVAQKLKISRRAVQRLRAKAGGIPWFKVENLGIRINEFDLELWQEKQQRILRSTETVGS